MTLHPALGPSPLDLDRMLGRSLRRRGVLLVEADDALDEVTISLHEVAARIAAASGARIVLLDRTDREPLWGPHARPPGPLSPEELRWLGRHDLADRLGALVELDLPAAAWLTDGRGTRELLTAIERTQAGLLLMRPDRPSVVRRVIRRTLPYYAARIAIPLATVDAAGAIELVEPLAGRSSPGPSRFEATARSTA